MESREKTKDSGRDQEPQRVLVTEASYQRIEPALEKVIEGLDLAGWYGGLKGKKVLIKPNMLGLFEPERHATTHPSLVSALVLLFREAGAEVMVGDNCGIGGYGLNRRAAKKTGIEEASLGAFRNVAQDTVQTKLDSRFLDSIVVSRDVLEADVVVSVPKMKTHGLTVVTGAVKNMFGMVAGAGKGAAHAAAPGLKDFARMLVSIYSLRPPDLTIMDGIVAMEGSGPSGGKPKPLGKILASTNAVACDAVMCRIMGFPPQEVYHLAYAVENGLGPVDPEAIEVLGKVENARFKLPVTVHKLRFVGRFVNQRFFAPVSRSRLILDRKLCKKCKMCVDGCPTGAMNMDDDLPWIDDEKCIRCLCCHELCPEQAWKTGGLLARFSSRRI